MRGQVYPEESAFWAERPGQTSGCCSIWRTYCTCKQRVNSSIMGRPAAIQRTSRCFERRLSLKFLTILPYFNKISQNFKTWYENPPSEQRTSCTRHVETDYRPSSPFFSGDVHADRPDRSTYIGFDDRRKVPQDQPQGVASDSHVPANDTQKNIHETLLVGTLHFKTSKRHFVALTILKHLPEFDLYFFFQMARRKSWNWVGGASDTHTVWRSR